MKVNHDPIENDFAPADNSDLGAVSFDVYDVDIFPTPASDSNLI